MGLTKVLLFILKKRMVHFGEIYRLISFHYFINKQQIDISRLRVLDVGFNKGVYRWYFKDLLGCSNYSGVEIDENYLDIFPNTFYHDFEKNQLKKHFDLIFCSHVLEHINNDSDFLINMVHSLSNDNGKILLRVPMPTDENVYFRKYNSKHHQDDEHERDGYTLTELIGLLSNVGLKVEKYNFCMGGLSLAIHTFFEILRDNQIRFQRVFQIPYIIISIIEIYFLNTKSSSDLLVLAVKVSKK
jgi:SAM-dependent methyltransferase